VPIYDCFTFFNEFDVLELRLHELSPVVDRFVLVEASTTHSGEPKPYYFRERQSEFSAFRDRITVVTVDDLPVLPNRWVAEQLQRNAIMRGLEDAADDDLVLITDVDEIPRPSVLSRLRDLRDGDVMCLVMDLYNYALNLRTPDLAYGPRATRRSTLRYLTPQEIRRTFIKNPAEPQHGSRDSIDHAGWHFSCLARPDELVERIRTKAQANAHSEADHPDVIDDARLHELIARQQLWWDASVGSVPLEVVPLDDSYPRYVVENRERWAPFIASENSVDQPRGSRYVQTAGRRIRGAWHALRGHD
jgi:beta-1,4-mannosyl-glycoprotein beta-1,4-N-acetylglucosaminyltransferase